MPVRTSTFVLPVLLGCGAVAAGSWVLRGGESAAPASAALAQSVNPMPLPGARPDDADPGAARARVQAQIAIFDARFAAEPVNADWARREERVFHEFFSTNALQAQGLAPPQQLETVCHSATCRISLRYADPLAAEQATQQLAVRLAGQLPYGAILPLALDDGSIQIDAWYSATRI